MRGEEMDKAALIGATFLIWHQQASEQSEAVGSVLLNDVMGIM